MWKLSLALLAAHVAAQATQICLSVLTGGMDPLDITLPKIIAECRFWCANEEYKENCRACNDCYVPVIEDETRIADEYNFDTDTEDNKEAFADEKQQMRTNDLDASDDDSSGKDQNLSKRSASPYWARTATATPRRKILQHGKPDLEYYKRYKLWEEIRRRRKEASQNINWRFPREDMLEQRAKVSKSRGWNAKVPSREDIGGMGWTMRYFKSGEHPDYYKPKKRRSRRRRRSVDSFDETETGCPPMRSTVEDVFTNLDLWLDNPDCVLGDLEWNIFTGIVDFLDANGILTESGEALGTEEPATDDLDQTGLKTNPDQIATQHDTADDANSLNTFAMPGTSLE